MDKNEWDKNDFETCDDDDKCEHELLPRRFRIQGARCRKKKEIERIQQKRPWDLIKRTKQNRPWELTRHKRAKVFKTPKVLF